MGKLNVHYTQILLRSDETTDFVHIKWDFASFSVRSLWYKSLSIETPSLDYIREVFLLVAYYEEEPFYERKVKGKPHILNVFPTFTQALDSISDIFKSDCSININGISYYNCDIKVEPIRLI